MKFSFLSNGDQLSSNQVESLIEHNSVESPWLKSLRLSALSKYTKQALPTRKSEHWKYNNMFFLSQSEFQIFSESELTPKSNTITTTNSLNFLSEDVVKIVIVDGHYCPELSTNIDSTKLVVTKYSKSTSSQQKIILNALNIAQQDKNLLMSLNSAIISDGLLLEIPNNQEIKSPIYIHHISNETEKNLLTTSQTIIHGGTNSKFSLIEDFVSVENPIEKLSLQQTIIHLQESCQCEHIRLNLEAENTKQISRVLTLLEKQSQLHSFYYSEGSQLSKTDIDVFHLGQHSESQLTGIYLPSNDRSIDYHTNVEHQVANCISKKTFRGIIADSSKAIFNGKIHIFKDAQKSDAQLNNKNLLLTNSGEINTKPELEIYADDVTCAHGATIAKIDDKAIYYLQTRGISEKQAKKMLSVGFINELLEKINNKTVADYLKQEVQTCLADIK